LELFEIFFSFKKISITTGKKFSKEILFLDNKRIFKIVSIIRKKVLKNFFFHSKIAMEKKFFIMKKKIFGKKIFSIQNFSITIEKNFFPKIFF
jgi:hypothetical protein